MAALDQNEVNRLIDEHTALLESMRQIMTEYDKWKPSEQYYVNRLLNSKEAYQNINAELNGETESLQYVEDIRSTIYYVALCKNLSGFGEEVKNTYQRYYNQIRAWMETLRRINYGVKWTLTSVANKAGARRAYNGLSSLLSGDYGQRIKSINQQFWQYYMYLGENYYQDFLNDKRSYLGYLQQMYPMVKTTRVPIESIKKVVANAWSIQEQCATAKPFLTNYTRDIIGAIDDLRFKLSCKKLETVPVESMLSGTNVRSSALINAGYQTASDIVQATKEELARVNGISMSGASLAKQKAKACMDVASREVRISLSIDNITPEKKSILRSIFVYHYKQSVAPQILEFISRYNGVYDAINNVQTLNNDIQWFFEDDKKNAVKTSFGVLSNYIKEYDDRIANCIRVLKGNAFYDDVILKDFEKNPIKYINTIEKVYPGIIGGDEDEHYGLSESLTNEIEEEKLPLEGLNCTLRRYQEWGVKYILHQKRVLLGDEMGLGKTIQAIATMVALHNAGAKFFMVVCPASVLVNWCREVEKHSMFKPIMVYGPERAHAFEYWSENGGVAITTYETTDHLKLFRYQIDLLVVDEAHYVKNKTTKRTMNVERISKLSKNLLFMTGTALENRVGEMISLIDMLNPRVARAAEKKAFMSQSDEFKNLVAPVYYRRKREEVLAELPGLIEVKEWCDMSAIDIDHYRAALGSRNFHTVRQAFWKSADLSKSSKAKRMMEIIEEAESEDRKVVVYSFYLDVLNRIQRFLGDRCVALISGAVSANKRQDLIDKFEAAKPGSVLVAQIQSGGVGLNIQCASIAIICEPQVKPSIENQAISRLYRMGQVRNVLVYRLLCSNSIDERMVKLLETKQKEFDAFADRSAAADKDAALDAQINENTIKSMLQEEIATHIKGDVSQTVLTQDIPSEDESQIVEIPAVIKDEREKKILSENTQPEKNTAPVSHVEVGDSDERGESRKDSSMNNMKIDKVKAAMRSLTDKNLLGRLDDNFVEAAKFAIKEGKVSIASLQVGLKQSFNSASILLDQLIDARVVTLTETSDEVKAHMSHEEFERLCRELMIGDYKKKGYTFGFKAEGEDGYYHERTFETNDYHKAVKLAELWMYDYGYVDFNCVE